MNTDELSPSDTQLVRAALEIISARYTPDWHVVGAALRLATGEIVTGVNLEANVGRIAVCAEAVALGRAVTEHGSGMIETIVAVLQPATGDPFVCAPCGMCRELIADYSPDAVVLLLNECGEVARRKVRDLLPEKYHRSPPEAGPAFSCRGPKPS